ncbi:MAG: translation initiation factor IF-2 [Candidatus Thermoplasmatota archaeon]|nr:translation initiation factor IF-2 [Candidatus Thermoplasmatota archaeon]
MIRQPILSVLGHIDHGKTTLLDYIRGSTVAEREFGKITQHIGATEIPIDKIYEMCGPLLQKGKIEIPGLLFIDTPGHRAFQSLRERGGSLADLAIIVIDINEGVMEQTIHSIGILKKHKTPFIIAANKIDLIDGWVTANAPFIINYKKQSDRAKEAFDEKFYNLLEQLYNNDVPCDRYDRITDFTQSFAIVPISAKSGEGIADLLATVVGLAQRFLKTRLELGGVGEGSILEIKEERGLGKTINAILYDGELKRNDMIAITGIGGPKKAIIKALFLPKSLSEMRDKKTRYAEVESVRAACGVKLVLQEDVDVIPGVPFRVCSGNVEDLCIDISLELDTEGVIVKADTAGSIEGVVFELKQLNRMVRKAEVGDVSKRDVAEAASSSDEIERVILAFNVKVLEEAREEAKKQGVKIISSSLIYELVDEYEEFCEMKEREKEEAKRAMLNYPASIEVLPGYAFRVSKPAIIGVRVIAGSIKQGMGLMNKDGELVGKVLGVQSSGKKIDQAKAGEEVAISIDKGVIGKNIKEGETLYSNIDEKSAKLLLSELKDEELKCLNRIIAINRKKNEFWAT